MKPIATVHWIEDKEERTLHLFDQNSLDRVVRNLTSEGKVNWTCLTGGLPPNRLRLLEAQ